MFPTCDPFWDILKWNIPEGDFSNILFFIFYNIVFYYFQNIYHGITGLEDIGAYEHIW